MNNLIIPLTLILLSLSHTAQSGVPILSKKDFDELNAKQKFTLCNAIYPRVVDTPAMDLICNVVKRVEPDSDLSMDCAKIENSDALTKSSLNAYISCQANTIPKIVGDELLWPECEMKLSRSLTVAKVLHDKVPLCSSGKVRFWDEGENSQHKTKAQLEIRKICKTLLPSESKGELPSPLSASGVEDFKSKWCGQFWRRSWAINSSGERKSVESDFRSSCQSAKSFEELAQINARLLNQCHATAIKTFSATFGKDAQPVCEFSHSTMQAALDIQKIDNHIFCPRTAAEKRRISAIVSQPKHLDFLKLLKQQSMGLESIKIPAEQESPTSR